MIIDFRFLGQNGGGSTSGGGMTSGDVQSIVESYNYVTSGQVETQITSKNYVTAEDIPDSTILKSVEELNSGTSIGDIQTKTAPSGEKIIYWNLEGSEGAELTVDLIPETWTDPTEHNLGQIRDKQVLGYGDDNWVTLYAYYNTTTNEPMIRVATEHSIEEYTLDEFGASSEGDELATFIDPENTAHTCTILVHAEGGAYVFTVNTDEGYDPNLIYDTTEFYDGFAFDGAYVKTSVSGYTKLATVEEIPDVSGFLASADFETATEVISTALNDLNERMSNIPSGSTHNAPIFIDFADEANNANEIWEAIVNDGYVPEVLLRVVLNGRLKNVRLNAYDYHPVYGQLLLSFQYENTHYLLTILYANSAATLSDYTISQFGVNTDGNILGVRKVAQTAYNELVASGETDETTAYYVVPDDPCSGYTQEECDCINSGGRWENGECNYAIVISAQTDAMSSSYSLPLTGVSAVTDANFDFTNVATIADGDYPGKPACKISNDSNGSRSSVEVVNITTSSVTTFDYAFNEMDELVSLSFDLTNATTAQNLYYLCPKLSSLTITFGDNPSVPSELNAGLENGNCPALTNVQINGTFPMCDIKLFASEYGGDKCSGLTSNSIDSIIAALPSGATGVTIYFGETVYNNMTQSQKNAIEDKGWNVSVQEASCDDRETIAEIDECYCLEDGGTWVEGEGESDAHCVYPCDDAENYDQCMCEEQGGNWVVDDSENEVGHCEGLESIEP